MQQNNFVVRSNYIFSLYKSSLKLYPTINFIITYATIRHRKIIVLFLFQILDLTCVSFLFEITLVDLRLYT